MPSDTQLDVDTQKEDKIEGEVPVEEPDQTDEHRPSVFDFIELSRDGDLSINPIDLLQSREGHASFMRDRSALSKSRRRKR